MPQSSSPSLLTDPPAPGAGASLHASLRLQGAPDQRPRLDLHFSLPPTGVTALFGPSGSGKTSILRCIAGLETPSAGSVRFNGSCWFDAGQGINLPSHRRQIGYIFQEARLFPHLSVTENLRYGMLRRAELPGGLSEAQVMEWLGLSPLLSRPVARLSGGERQRVAIGRALLSRPRLLLMDEPLSALDFEARDEILARLEQLVHALAIPVLYVSHSRREVSRLADRIIWIRDGRLLATGAVQDLFSRPELAEQQRRGQAAILECRVCGDDPAYHLTRLRWGGDDRHGLWVEQQGLTQGERLRLQIHSRDISLSLSPSSDSSILNRIPVTIDSLYPYTPATELVRLKAGDQYLLAQVTRRSADALRLKPGLALYALIKSVALLNDPHPAPQQDAPE